MPKLWMLFAMRPRHHHHTHRHTDTHTFSLTPHINTSLAMPKFDHVSHIFRWWEPSTLRPHMVTLHFTFHFSEPRRVDSSSQHKKCMMLMVTTSGCSKVGVLLLLIFAPVGGRNSAARFYTRAMYSLWLLRCRHLHTRWNQRKKELNMNTNHGSKEMRVGGICLPLFCLTLGVHLLLTYIFDMFDTLLGVWWLRTFIYTHTELWSLLPPKKKLQVGLSGVCLLRIRHILSSSLGL